TLLFGHKMRLKTKDQILAELESLYLRRWRGGVFIVDDNFIGNKRELKVEVLPAMINWMEERKYPFSFTTQVSINLSDDEELMRLMVQAGFGSVFVGIETPNEKSLAECGKSQNKNRDLIACVKKIQKFGLVVNGGFIIGFDNDTPAIFERMIEFVQKSGIVSAMVGLLNAPRGTKLYQRLVKENRLLKEATGDNTDFSVNFIPKMNYKPKCYYERVLTLLKNMKPLKKKRYQFHLCYLTAFFKSIWQLGIIGKERIYYWKIFFWTLFRRPQLLPMAITYAVYGFHFRKIYKNY
ncbi:B12-binding domain-containing radical SAM protein, partial [Candidatus Atribacteria bacterium HGW-Atribacteria-1]